MDTFDHFLNWKLKAGSHHFSGKDGGTCINEATLVATGFPYKPICFVDQMPECFSRPICRLAMQLNDRADDEERQRLLRYVTRLACADTPEIENRRAAYIAWRMSGYTSALPFDRGLEVLEGALAIGRQADPLGLEQVATYMEAVKAAAPTLTSLLDRPFFSEVKSWLTMKETDAAT